MAALLLLFYPCASAYTCKFPAPDNTVYDLSALMRTSAPDYAVSGTDHYEYRVNVCQTVIQSCAGDFSGVATQWEVQGNCVAVLARESPHLGGSNLPRLDYIDADDPTVGVSLTYYNGDFCHPTKAVERTVEYRIYCEKGTHAAVLRAFEVDNCKYIVDFASEAGCSPSLSSQAAVEHPRRTSLLLPLCVIALVGYCLIGTLLNRLKSPSSPLISSIPHSKLIVSSVSMLQTATSDLIASLRQRIEGQSAL